VKKQNHLTSGRSEARSRFKAQKNRRRSLISSYSLQTTAIPNQQGLYFLAAGFFAGEAAFFATFLAGGAFLAAGFLAAGFLAAGFAVAFFAAGISYPPFHSAVAEDKKIRSLQFA